MVLQRKRSERSQGLSAKAPAKKKNEVTVHGQVNELSPMWSC